MTQKLEIACETMVQQHGKRMLREEFSRLTTLQYLRNSLDVLGRPFCLISFHTTSNPGEKDVSKNFSIFACVFIIVVKSLLSHCLAVTVGYTYRDTQTYGRDL
jgi:hypothetical protein